MESYGQYHADLKKNKIPALIKFTDTIHVAPGLEFGYVLKIEKAKGLKLRFKIDHPPFKDSSGGVAPPFTGEVTIKKNIYSFFLGDTFWEPYNDKAGLWELTTWIEKKEVAYKQLNMIYIPESFT